MSVEEERDFLKKIKNHLHSEPAKARADLFRELSSRSSFRFITDALKLIRSSAQHETRELKPLRIGILGTSTVDQLSLALETFLIRDDFLPEIYLAPYNQVNQEILDPQSGLYRHKSDILIVTINSRDIILPDNRIAWSAKDAEKWAAEEAAARIHLLNTFKKNSSARIIQFTSDIPRTTPWGGLGSFHPGGPAFLFRELNRALALSKPDGVYLFDVDLVAADFGKHRWEDERYWFIAKQAWDLDGIPLVTHKLSRIIRGWMGRACKVLALDLDNTLWGGVVGDAGFDGVIVGDTAEGEAYAAFQKYILELKNRGILLALLSKNDEANAKEVFEKNPGMVLKWDDFVAAKINWNPKPENLKAMARELNLGIDSFCFVDDNPVERDMMRQMLQEVQVVDLPSDPALYARALDDAGLFELPAFSETDAGRTEQYHSNRKRDDLQNSATTMEEFYAQLKQEIFFSPFNEQNLNRVVQLINKTNQFNLTTKRYSEEDVRAFISKPKRYFTLAASVKDRFGDSGLIGVMIGRIENGAVEVDTWLMSCRVLGRKVEDAMMDRFLRAAATRGCSEVRGEYIPTRKNGLVAGLYEKMGFQKMHEGAGGDTTRWTKRASSDGLGVVFPMTVHDSMKEEGEVHVK